MSAYWIWWIAGAVLVAAELLTGTFYLLVIGLALACGGIAAWFDAAMPVQWLTAGVLGIAGTFFLQRWRKLHKSEPVVQQSLDVGQLVQVQNWGPDGTARVAYRGTTWDAELDAPATPRNESMYITAMRGSVLILSDQRPSLA